MENISRFTIQCDELSNNDYCASNVSRFLYSTPFPPTQKSISSWVEKEEKFQTHFAPKDLGV